jgi:hypothetical protein
MELELNPARKLWYFCMASVSALARLSAFAELSSAAAIAARISNRDVILVSGFVIALILYAAD